jgi:osmotically-inducible protein OsmY
MKQSFRGRGPKGFQRSDERVRELVSERLEDHDAIDASDIEVTVNSGEVTLSGTVDDRRTKRLAEDVAESVAGVKDVHNNLKVDRNFFSRMADTIRDAVEGPKDSR